MQNTQKFAYVADGKNLELVMSPSQNPNGLFSILINVREKDKYVGTIRLNIQWIDFLKFIDYSYTWPHYFKAAFELFIRRKYADTLLKKSDKNSIIDIDEDFEFV